MDTQEDWPLPQLVKSYTSLDCLQTLLEGRGPEKVCAERLHILVNCLSGFGWHPESMIDRASQVCMCNSLPTIFCSLANSPLEEG